MTPTPLTQQRQRTITTITDALTGETTPYITGAETIIGDPSTGSTEYTIANNLVLTADARITPIEQTFTCRACNTRLLSTAVSKACRDCRVLLCSACAKNPPLCPSCRWKDRLKRLLRWLTRL